MSDARVRETWRALMLLPTVEAAIEWLVACARGPGWPQPGHHELADGLHERAPLLFRLTFSSPFPTVGSRLLEGRYRTHRWPSSPRNRKKEGKGEWWWPYRQVSSPEWVEVQPACGDGTIVRLQQPEFVGQIPNAIAWLEKWAVAVRFPDPTKKLTPRCPCGKRRQLVPVHATCRACARERIAKVMGELCASRASS